MSGYLSVFWYAVYAAVGLLGMLFLRKFPPARQVAKMIHFDIDCNLCLGFWVYTVSSFWFCTNVLSIVYWPFISEIITGAFTAWLVDLLVTGWNGKYRVLEVK